MEAVKDIRNDNYKNLLEGERQYIIPKFQRDYAWDKENWDDLFEDILSLKNGEEEEHYMGYLVLKKIDEIRSEVIDGQQRLVTLSILILAINAVLSDLENDLIENEGGSRKEYIAKTIENFSYRFLSAELNEKKGFASQNKIKLNKSCDNFYDNLIKNQRINTRHNAEKRLLDCFNWFKAKIQSTITDNKVDFLVEFVKTISEKLYFTKMIVKDNLNAFKVFETLNARGVELSSSDLLKNYLFSIAAKEGEEDVRFLSLLFSLKLL
jgi:uncharacterized protein with ParB-like and HNH nuclease domain